jgi:Ca-activated chloride channel family protein
MRNLVLVLGFVLAISAGENVRAAERAIIVFDASGSMWGQIGGETKISIAQKTLAEVLADVPAALELGFVAYGHREKGNCADIELMVPPGAATGNEIAAAANRLTPLGKTPISDAVRQAAIELRYTHDKATVILITDGIETCEADPCAVAAELERSGVDLTVHVVGFGLSQEEGRQVSCLAENTGGEYFSAGDADALADALETTVTVVQPPPAPEPAPLPEPEPELEPGVQIQIYLAEGVPFEGHTQGGVSWEIVPAEEGTAGAAPPVSASTLSGTYVVSSIEPGRYTVRAKAMLAAGETDFEVKPGGRTEVAVVLNAGVIRPRALLSENGAPPSTDTPIAWSVIGPTGAALLGIGYGSETNDAVVPPGSWKIRVERANIVAEEPVEVTAGETKEVTVVLNVGRIRARIVASESRPIPADAGTVTWRVAGPAGDVATGYGTEYEIAVPAGRLVLGAQLNNAAVELPVEVAAGETEEVVIALPAGRLMLYAKASGGTPHTGAVAWTITGPDGQDVYCGTGYAERACDVAAGLYKVTATLGDTVVEEEISVPAGEAVARDFVFSGS